MEIFVLDSYEAMSQKAAADLLQIMQGIEKPLICPASGDSPAGLYKELVEQVNTNLIDITGWSFISLDEWAGMNGSDEGSCRFYLNDQLFGPLKVGEERIVFFDGRAQDLQQECDKVENFIDTQGGIDLAIVGLGMNGHVGMNEPGTSAALRTHVADIDIVTQKTGQKYFKEPKILTQGITLGLATLMEAATVMLVVSGKHKAAIVKKILEEEISEARPASILRNHPNFKVYLDKDAAAGLQSQFR